MMSKLLQIEDHPMMTTIETDLRTLKIALCMTLLTTHPTLKKLDTRVNRPGLRRGLRLSLLRVFLILQEENPDLIG